MTEGSVNTWIKQPGEHIEKGEMLFTVSTDKVDMEVESTGSGFLNPVVEVGKTVPVGTVIAVLTDKPGESVNATGAKAPVNGHSAARVESVSESASPARLGAADAPALRSFPASPRARSLAKTLGVDIAEVTPESGNRIIEADVKKFAETRTLAEPEPMTAARRITAERTAESFERAPHFYVGRELNAGALVRLREELKPVAQRKLGFAVTYTDVLLRALALALREHPVVNCYWKDGELCRRDGVNVGFAAQTEQGLLVPVINGADRSTLFEIAAKRRELAERARQGKLRLEEMEGGGATLSNLGAHGVDWFQAILNPPQSVILAAGEITKRPVVINNRVETGETLILCLSADHRVLDGVTAATFLSAIARMVSDPLELLV
jgi:pyruvate dehydrogenase E2 component (dihydrolipoamide acetyltransferase)